MVTEIFWDIKNRILKPPLRKDQLEFDADYVRLAIYLQDPFKLLAVYYFRDNSIWKAFKSAAIFLNSLELDEGVMSDMRSFSLDRSWYMIYPDIEGDFEPFEKRPPKCVIL